MTKISRVLKGKTVPTEDPSLAIYDEMARSADVVEEQPPGAKVLAMETPADKHPEIAHYIEALQTQENGRTQLGNKLWAEITAVYTESGDIDDGSTKVVTTTPNVTGYVTITSATACVPSGATGTLKLGHITLYLPAGVSNLVGLTVQLGQTDTRSLTVSSAGATSLLLCGHVSPMNAQLPI